MNRANQSFTESVFQHFTAGTSDTHPSMSVQLPYDRLKADYPLITGTMLQSALLSLHEDSRIDCREGYYQYSEVYRLTPVPSAQGSAHDSGH